MDELDSEYLDFVYPDEIYDLTTTTFRNIVESYEPGIDIEELLIHITKLTFSTASVVASLLAIYVLFKFKLYKANLLITSFFISEVGLSAFTVTYVILQSVRIQYQFSAFCILFQFYNFCRYVSTSSMLLTGGLWLLDVKKPELFQKYRNIHLYVLVLICLISLLTFSILVHYGCIAGLTKVHDVHNLFIFRAWLAITLLTIIVLNIVACSTPLNSMQLATKYHLTVSTYVLGSYLPMFILEVVFLFSIHLYFDTLVHIVVEICLLLLTVTPIGVVYLLGRCSREFRMAYDRIFKRSVRHYDINNLDGNNEHAERSLINSTYIM